MSVSRSFHTGIVWGSKSHRGQAHASARRKARNAERPSRDKAEVAMAFEEAERIIAGSAAISKPVFCGGRSTLQAPKKTPSYEYY